MPRAGWKQSLQLQFASCICALQPQPAGSWQHPRTIHYTQNKLLSSHTGTRVTSCRHRCIELVWHRCFLLCALGKVPGKSFHCQDCFHSCLPFRGLGGGIPACVHGIVLRASQGPGRAQRPGGCARTGAAWDLPALLLGTGQLVLLALSLCLHTPPFTQLPLVCSGHRGVQEWRFLTPTVELLGVFTILDRYCGLKGYLFYKVPTYGHTCRKINTALHTAEFYLWNYQPYKARIHYLYFKINKTNALFIILRS